MYVTVHKHARFTNNVLNPYLNTSPSLLEKGEGESEKWQARSSAGSTSRPGGRGLAEKLKADSVR